MWKLTRLSSLQETKKLSLSSSEEKSSEFGWLENENEMKNEREGKTEQGSVYSIYDQYYGLHIWSSSFTVDAREYI